jgi:predicted transcriptional regulator
MLAVTVSRLRSSRKSASALVLRAKSEGKNPAYYVLGETEAGRHLFCVVISFPDGRGYPVTAREMTASEKQRYSQWKKP